MIVLEYSHGSITKRLTIEVPNPQFDEHLAHSLVDLLTRANESHG
jgi:hypothetical protein